VLGIKRCFTQGTDTTCVADGQPCAFADECCSGFCLPDANGDLTCGVTCVPLAGACTADGDCCDGVCVNGSCQPSQVSCVPLGGQCEESADCCSGYCDENNGVCAVLIG
jgi:hypothetical protein